jgi:D-alanine-D-alanine ligase-like ATP-grasp enzyme
VAHADTGVLRGYFYEEGYLRTSCKEYTTDKLDNKMVHLTNDAIQKTSPDYGKFESSNKISYAQYQKILMDQKNISFTQTVLPRIKEQVTDVFKAAGSSIYSSGSKPGYNGFELMGFDFMLDDDMNLFLIEVNTNPCLDTPCILLQRIIL